MTALVLGVDPGRKGALALIDPDGARVRDDGRAEAALLADYGRRQGT